MGWLITSTYAKVLLRGVIPETGECIADLKYQAFITDFTSGAAAAVAILDCGAMMLLSLLLLLQSSLLLLLLLSPLLLLLLPAR